MSDQPAPLIPAPSGYADWLLDLKTRIHSAQQRVVLLDRLPSPETRRWYAAKAIITQWINPSDYRKPQSVAKAKKAISDYKKALGQPEGLAELMVFYCEEVFDFLAGCGMNDEGFYDARVSGVARVEFSWSGVDENDPVSGRGWLEVMGDQAQGRIFIHLGDDSGFTAVRAG